MSDSKKVDLTRIEDLGEFLHQDDPETDRALLTSPLKPGDGPPGLPTENDDAPELAGLDELETETPAPETTIEAASEDVPMPEVTLEEPTFENEDTQGAIDASISTETISSDESSLDLGMAAELTPAQDELEPSGFETLPLETTPEESALFSSDSSMESEPAETSDNADPVLQDPFAVEIEPETTAASFDDANIDNQSASLEMPQTDQEFQVPAADVTLPDLSSPNLSPNTTSKNSVLIQALTPLEKPSAPPPPAPREDLADLKKFGNAVTSGAIKAGGNPPFSVMINRIRYRQDADELLSILEDVGLAEGSLRKDIEQGLQTGALLLGQLSEYSAIYLAHRIRHLDIDVRVGLGEQIHQSKYYDSEYRGLVERENLAQNKELKALLTERPITPEEITVSTSPTIEGHEIKNYINIIRESVVMSEEAIEQRAAHNKRNLDSKNRTQTNYPIEGDHNAQWSQHIDDIYEELTQILKIKAHQLGGNAIIGLSFGLTPLILDHRAHYRIIAFGNVVRLARANTRTNTRTHETIS